MMAGQSVRVIDTEADAEDRRAGKAGSRIRGTLNGVPFLVECMPKIDGTAAGGFAEKSADNKAGGGKKGRI